MLGTRLTVRFTILSRLFAVLAALGVHASSAPPALANRFGPPWQAEVAPDQAVVYGQPNDAAAPIGPLGKGAIVVVLGTPTPGWVSTNLGFVHDSDLTESDRSWVAEVVAPSVAVYAKPYTTGGIRRTAQKGDLLRVAGVSPGLNGDMHVWWSTTEGYVTLDSIAPSYGEWARAWTLPDPASAAAGWWGRMTRAANVRAGATTDAPIVGQFAGGEWVKVLAEDRGEPVLGNATWYRVDGGRYVGAWIHSSLIARLPAPRANTTAPAPDATGRWIVVDRAAKTLTLAENGSPLFATYVALGQAGRETPDGDYSTFLKYRADDMTSTSVPGATDFYDLPNVPFAQYYKDGGFAIHGTYWHDLYGTDQSHGCINVTWTDSAYLFAMTDPVLPAGQVRAIPGPGGASTPVVIVN